ncbi:MAG: type VI secretion system-associated protein TagF [Pseudomonadota bacterium]
MQRGKTAMGHCGFFGKIPSAGDFVSHNLPPRIADTWADKMAGWMAASKKSDREAWMRQFLTSPIWRFVLPAGVIGPQAWCGLLAGSTDSVGREFPFTVLMSTSIDTQRFQPIRILDTCFDRIEERTLTFIEGQASRTDLMSTLEQNSLILDRAIAEMGTGSEQGSIAIPRPGHAAICLSRVESDDNDASIYSWPMRPGGAGTPGLCLWWHEGDQAREPEFCVSRGPLDPAAIAPFFWGDWKGHGWTRHRALEYGAVE